MSFRLVPKLVTLNNLEWRNGPYFALFHQIWKACIPTPNRFLEH